MTGYPESNPYSSVEKKPKRKKTVIIIAAGALAAALIAAAIIIIVNINKADQTAKINSQSFSNLNLYTSNGRFYADEDNYYFTNGKKYSAVQRRTERPRIRFIQAKIHSRSFQHRAASCSFSRKPKTALRKG